MIKAEERERQRVYRAEYRATLRAAGLCRECKQTLDTNTSQCTKCKVARKEAKA